MKKERVISFNFNKKGQFYLMTAIIISVFVAGFAILTNFTIKKDSVRINDLKQELNIESENVLNYGLYNGYSSSSMNDLIQTFTDDYIDYQKDNKEFYFIFGTQDLITAKGYSQSTKTIYVDAGTGETPISLTAQSASSQDLIPSGNEVNLTIDGDVYDFQLKNGENFFFVISQEKGGEKYVAKN